MELAGFRNKGNKKLNFYIGYFGELLNQVINRI